MVTVASNSVGEKWRFSGYAASNAALEAVVVGAGLLHSEASRGGRSTVRIRLISPDERIVDASRSSLRAEITRLMPSLDELDKMAEESSREWFDDRSGMNDDRQ